jgi:hypothetical protein
MGGLENISETDDLKIRDGIATFGVVFVLEFQHTRLVSCL